MLVVVEEVELLSKIDDSSTSSTHSGFGRRIASVFGCLTVDTSPPRPFRDIEVVIVEMVRRADFNI